MRSKAMRRDEEMRNVRNLGGAYTCMGVEMCGSGSIC